MVRLPFVVPFLHGFRGGDGRTGQKRSAADCGVDLRRMIGLTLAGVRCPHSVPHGARTRLRSLSLRDVSIGSDNAGGNRCQSGKEVVVPVGMPHVVLHGAKSEAVLPAGMLSGPAEAFSECGLPCRAVMRASGLRHVRTNACAWREDRTLRTAALGGAA